MWAEFGPTDVLAMVLKARDVRRVVSECGRHRLLGPTAVDLRENFFTAVVNVVLDSKERRIAICQFFQQLEQMTKV